MSNQSEEGWYPECNKCGDGNLVESITFCKDCWEEFKKKLKDGAGK